MIIIIKMTINESQVNTDEDPELKELFSVDTFPRVMLWSKRFNKLFSIEHLINTKHLCIKLLNLLHIMPWLIAFGAKCSTNNSDRLPFTRWSERDIIWIAMLIKILTSIDEVTARVHVDPSYFEILKIINHSFLRWGDGDFEKGHQTYNKSWGMNSTNIQQWLNNQLL